MVVDYESKEGVLLPLRRLSKVDRGRYGTTGREEGTEGYNS